MFNNDGPRENTTIDAPELFKDDPSEFEEVDDEDDICDCDPKYKDSHPIQQSAGVNFGGIGGQKGDGTTVIVCRNCGGRFYENKEDDTGMDMMW
jgi:hypothetical protein